MFILKYKTIKKFGKITGRIFLTLFIVVYVVVALVNYSLVQSFVGSAVSSHFTREWGGKVRIASMSCNPFNHLVLRKVELINPESDTIFVTDRITLRFKEFPVSRGGLNISHAAIKNGRYHLNIDTVGLNLQYIIDYFATEEEDTTTSRFVVLVDDLQIDNFTYLQDLPDTTPPEQRGVHPWVDVMHMELHDLNARFRNVRVDNGNVTCRVDQLSVRERSGFEIKELSSNIYVASTGIGVTNLRLETDNSLFMGDVLLDYDSWLSMGYFLDSIYFTANILPGSYTGMEDAAYWASPLWGMNQRIDFSGAFSGPIQDLSVEGLRVAFGDESVIDMDASIYGLPGIDTTVISANIRKLHTSYADLAAVRHPQGIEMKAERIVKILDHIDLRAYLSGTLTDVRASLEVLSAPGDLRCDVTLAKSPQSGQYRYSGVVSSDGLTLNELAPNEWVSRSGLELTFHGTGFNPKTMTAKAEGRLRHTVLRGQRVMGETAFDLDASGGKVTAELSLDDALMKMMVDGEVQWVADKPTFTANIDAEHVDMKRLGLWADTNDKEAVIDAHIDGRYMPLSEGQSYARVTLGKFNLNSTTRVVHLRNATLTAREQNHWKQVNLSSDFADLELKGYLRYDGIGQLIDKFRSDYLPYIGEGMVATEDVAVPNYDKIADARFELNMKWHDHGGILQSFVPDLMIANGTTLQANYNFAESFKPLLRSDSLGWGGVKMYNVGVNGSSISNRYRMRVTSDEVMIGKLMLSERADLIVETACSEALCRLYWENNSETVGNGDIRLRLSGESDRISLLVDHSELSLGGKTWLLGSSGESCFNSRGWWTDTLSLSSGAQSLNVMASMVGDVNDSLMVLFNDFDLSIANPIIGFGGMSAEGTANGNVKVGGLSEVPYLVANLAIDSLLFNDELIGDAMLRSWWNAELNILNLSLISSRTDDEEVVSPLDIRGYITLGEEDPELDFTVSVESLGLDVLRPFVSSFSSVYWGYLNGDIDIGGTLSKPEMSGYIFANASMIIDFLNVPFNFSDTIYIEPGKVRLDDFEISDAWGHTGVLRGTIDYENLEEIEFDLSVSSDEMLCMNTGSRHSDVYYGTVLASLDGTVRGPVDDIDVVLNARTLEGTTLQIPINNRRQVIKADYIHFVSDEEEIAIVSDEPSNSDPLPYSTVDAEAPSSSFRLTINVETTPDMRLHLPMEFSTVMVDVKATGSGTLQLIISNEEPFAIIGDYEMLEGTFMLDLLGAFSREFALDQGSKITFPGSVEDARFDINASYSQKVNLSSLTGNFTSTETQKSIQVKNIISLNGTLQSLDIDFDIDLPNADQSVQDEVFSYIDRTNERDMLNQTISLLIFNKFYSSTNNSSTEGDAVNAAEEGYSLVANTLGSVVSDMLGNIVDINFKHTTGNALMKERIDLSASKEWNKLYFETTLGIGGDAREVNSDGNNNVNNLIGDMLVGYKINPNFHLFVFNRNTSNDYTRSDLPYKQGVGIKFTHDFDRIDELFRRRRNKTEK